MRYNIKINNRDILSNICINELDLLLTKVEFILDRLMLLSMICGALRLIGNNTPLKLATVCNIIDCKDCNYCKTCCSN